MTDFLRDAVRQEIDTGVSQGRALTVGAVGVSPDAAAAARSQARTLGVTDEFAIRNPDFISAESNRRKVDKTLATSPKLVEWLSAKPSRFAVASDDLENLARVGQVAEETGGFRAAPEPGVLREFAERAVRGFKTGQVGVGLLFDELGLFPSIPESGAARAVRISGGLRDSDRFVGAGETARSALAQRDFDRAREKGGLIAAISAVVSNPGEVIGVSAESLGRSAPVLLAATVGSTLGGPFGAVPAVAGTSFSIEFAASLLEGIEGSGIDATNPAELRRALENEELMADARRRGVLRGIPIAAFDALSAGLAGRLLAGASGSLGSAAARVAGEVGLQAGSGAAGEFTAQVVSGDELDFVDIALEAFAEIPTAGAEAPGNIRFARNRARLREGRERIESARQSAGDALTLDDIHDAAKGSRMVERSPDEAESFVRSVIDGAGEGTPKNVYIDGGELREFFQSQGFNPEEELGKLTGEPLSLAVALETGGDVVIPLERYMSRVATSQFGDGIKDISRLGPDRLSNKELAGLDAERLFGGLIEEPAASPGAQIVDTVAAQLESAGMDPAASRAVAESVAARFETRAQRRGLGENPFELFESEGVTFRRGQTEARTETPIPDDIREFQQADGTRPAQSQELSEALALSEDEFIQRINPEGRTTPPDQVDRTAVDDFSLPVGGREVASVESGGEAVAIIRHPGEPIRFTATVDGVAVGALSVTPSGNVVNEVAESFRGRGIGKELAKALIREAPFTPAGSLTPAGEAARRAAFRELKEEAGATALMEAELRSNDSPDSGGVDTAEGSGRAQSEFNLNEAEVGGLDQVDFTLRDFEQGGAARETAPRGRIIFGERGAAAIELLDGANLSTAHHELGHLFFEELITDAFAEGTPAQLRSDLDAALKWIGAKNRVADGLEAIREEVATSRNELHENFARGYEAYLFEGNAPSAELETIFARFRAWMTFVYRALTRLNVRLTDDVRQVYDRLLATDDAIAEAEFSAGVGVMNLPEDAKATIGEARFRKYVERLEQARQEEKNRIDNELLAVTRREQTALWKEQESKVRAEVTDEAIGRSDFNAISVMRRGKFADGTEAPEGMRLAKIDRKEAVALYGEDFVREVLDTKGITKKRGGIAVGAAAALFGYPDGASFVRAMAAVPDFRGWIDSETAARMRDRNPDPLLDGSLPQKATAGVHGSRRLAAIEDELSIIADLAGTPAPRGRVFRGLAERLISERSNRNIRPNDFLVAERKAARAAFTAAAAGNFAEALKAKRQQLLNAHLFRAARDSVETFNTSLRFLRRFTKKNTRAEIGKAGGQYLEQIDAIMETLDLKQASGAEVQRRQALAEWVAAREAQGEQITVPDAVLALTEKVNIRDLKMETLVGLVDTVKQIEHLAKLKNKLRLAGQLRDLAEVDEAMAESVLASKDAKPDTAADRSRADRMAKAAADIGATLLRPSTIVRALDGFKDSGPVWTATVGAMQTAVNENLSPALKAAEERIAEVFTKHYSKDELRAMNRPVARDGMAEPWSKGRILSVLLNWGNQENREAVTGASRGAVTEAQAQALFRTLDARDIAFAAEVWQYIGSFWPEIARVSRERTGLTPRKVEATPFSVVLADGSVVEVQGGYYPLKYDSDSHPKANLDEMEEFWQAMRTGRSSKAHTRDGHRQERVGGGGRTVRLDISVLSQHVRDVLRDIHLGDTVNSVNKALSAPEFRSALADTGRLEYGRALELWLRDIAVGEIAPRTFVERLSRAIRQNFTASVLGFNVSTAMIQPTGLLQSNVVLGREAMSAGLRRFMQSKWVGKGNIFEQVDEVSGLMRGRAQVHSEAVRVLNQTFSGGAPIAAAFQHYAFWMMTRTQRLVDAITWLAAESKGLDQFGGDVQAARRFADDVVQRAQASGQLVDKSAIERGTLSLTTQQSEIVRLATPLMSYMMAKGNVAFERFGQTDFRDVGQVLKFTGDMVSLFLIEGVIIAILRGGLPSDGDDDDDLTDWLAFAAGTALSDAAGTLPGVGLLASELRGYNAQGVIARMATVTGNFVGQASQGEFDRAFVNSAVTLTGAVTGLPSAQTNRMLNSVWDASEGEDVAFHEFFIGRRKQ